MAEQVKIVNRNWYNGMWNDEYTWGFYYWENVDIRTNSRAFKLSNRVVPLKINERWDDILIKLFNYNDEVLSLSDTWHIESSQTYNDFAAQSSNSWWYLFKRWSTRNGILFWEYFVWATSTQLNALKLWTASTYWMWLRWAEKVLNPWLTSDTNWTTSWWWTFWTWWATHTTWTDTLSQTVSTLTAGTGRLAVYISWHTTWTLVISYDWEAQVEITAKSDRRYTYNIVTTTSDDIVITPSTDFNWTIERVSVRQYDDTKFDLDSADLVIQTSVKKPMIYDGWILYVWSWNKIDSIDTTLTFWSWVLENAITLQPSDSIIWITKIWDIYNIYANNWIDWIKYILSWIDEFPAEKIIWKNKQFVSVDNDWNNDYVVCWNNYKKYLYVTNWYTKQLITQSWYMLNYNSNYEAYRLDNRYNFDDVIWFIWDKVILWAYYWAYTYWTYTPWLPASIVKERANSDSVDIARIRSITDRLWTPYIAYRTLTNYNYIWEIRQYQYVLQWYIVTNPMVFEWLSTEKILEKSKIWYLLPSSTTSINIYARVNDKHFYTFTVSWLTTTPTAWATYSEWTNVFTVVKTNITWWAWTISCSANMPTTSDFDHTWTLTKVSWDWDASISYTDRDNFILVKTITTDKYRYWNDYILSNDMVGIQIPNIYKIQYKIELLSTNSNYTPEVSEIPVLASQDEDGI
jgi:hypothetical protein